MEKRYKALRAIAAIMKVLGILTAILTVFAALSICGAGTLIGAEFDRYGRQFGGGGGLGALTGLVGGLFATILPLLMGGGLSLFLFAAGDVLYVQIDIEENTRTMVLAVRDQGENIRALNWLLRDQARLPTPQENNPPFMPPAPAQITSTEEAIDELEENIASYQYCPQCGTKLVSAEDRCPSCGYEMHNLLS